MASDAAEAMVRAKQYAYRDGLGELAAGAIFWAIAGLFTIESAMPPGSPLAGLSAVGLPVVVLAGIYVAGRGVAAAKRRLVYPRTGMIRYRQPSRRRRMAAAAVAALTAMGLVVQIASMGEAAVPWIPFLTATVIGLFLAYFGYVLHLQRFYALGAASAGLGAIAAYAAPNETAGSAAYFWTMGACLLASGAYALHEHVRLHPGSIDSGAVEEQSS